MSTCCPLPARDIYIVKELEDVDVMECQTVTFQCEVNHLDVDGRWYRDDSRIRPGDNIKIRHEGKYECMYVCMQWASFQLKSSNTMNMDLCCLSFFGGIYLLWVLGLMMKNSIEKSIRSFYVIS